jgi:formylglycine-generating enzyme required for sulfatase activity
MLGNAAEWCADPYEGDPESRVVRGGSCFAETWLMRASARYGCSVSDTSDEPCLYFCGLRVARDP